MGSAIEPIYGPIMIGIIVVLLYGIMITQTYLYYNTFKEDKTWIKYFVALLFFACTLNTGFDVAFLYMRLVNDFGDLPAVVIADWVFNTDPAMTSIVAFMVQIFFAWRVKLLTNSTPLTIVIVLFSTVQLLSGIATAIACGIVKPFVEFHKFKVVVILWLAFSAIADIIIALALVLTLRRNRTGFAATDDIINRLVRLTVQTGAITALFAIIDLVTFLASTSGLHLAFNFPLAHLYTNSLLSTLNARALANPSGKYGGSSSGGGGRNGSSHQRKDLVDIEFSSRNRASKVMMNPIESRQSHEMNDVGRGTKVYMDVEVTEQVAV